MILKLKRTPGIYLVGFMGSGKTTVGKRLANELGWSFADLDDDIEAAQQMAIGEIFRTLGEPEFRRIEAAQLRKRVRVIECGRPMVLALGGGAFVERENFEMVTNNGVTIWLDCSFERIVARTRGATHRPLAEDPEKFAQLYETRRPFYSQADFRIEVTSDDESDATGEILRLPLF
jgi:shikimate kinase